MKHSTETESSPFAVGELRFNDSGVSDGFQRWDAECLG